MYAQALVSVVIPIYNGERYIGETVRSMLSQTYANLEIICIIDGTKDASAQMLRDMNDERIRVYEQDNCGATRTRNRGLALAVGDYVLFLDQDDVLAADFVAHTVAELERTNATGVAANGHLIDGQGRRLRRMYRFGKPKLTLGAIVRGNQLYTPSQVLLHREKLQAIGEFDVDAAQADDWDMWVRHVLGGKLVFLDRDLVGYRLHDQNQSSDYHKMLASEHYIIARKLSRLAPADRLHSEMHMRYARRAGSFRSLAVAIRLNRLLLIQPRLYWAMGRIAWKYWRSGAASQSSSM